MAALADRLTTLATRYGSDPASWQRDIQALASLEEQSPKEAHRRFHELKRLMAHARRAELLRALRAFAFVDDVPSEDTEGMGLKEIERELSLASRALVAARRAQDALREADELRAGLRLRRAPEPAPLPVTPWSEAEQAADEAERQRRAVAREARIEARALDAQRRARKLGDAPVAMPDLTSVTVPDAEEADRMLARIEDELAVAEALEDAHRAVTVALRPPEIAAYRRGSRKQLLAEAREALAVSDRREGTRSLKALLPKAQSLAREAAALAEQAVRARRLGGTGPASERAARDSMDMYG